MSRCLHNPLAADNAICAFRVLHKRSEPAAGRLSGLGVSGVAMSSRKVFRLPFTLELKHAAVALSISEPTLVSLIASGLVWTVHVADRELIPVSEVRRLATIRRGLPREPSSRLRAVPPSRPLKRR